MDKNDIHKINIEYLGVQQCFGVVYHTTTNTLLNPFQQRQYKYNILLSDFQIRQNEAWVITI